jgi:HlyD family secretion protein
MVRPAISVVAALLLLVFGSCDFVSNLISSEELIEVETVTVSSGEISEAISAPGKVVPEATQAITSDTIGEISEVLFEEGDDVAEGQVLVDFERLEPATSSLAGRVIKVNCFQGQTATIGTPLATIGHNDTQLVTSNATAEISVVEVEPGDNVTAGQILVDFKQPEPARSPVDGNVYRISCLRGQMVTVGTPLMIIYDDDEDLAWQVTSETTGEISEILVEEGTFTNDILVELGDEVVKNQAVVSFKQLEPVISPVDGKVLRIDCLKGQKTTLGTPLMTIGDEKQYLISSDTNGEIAGVLVELGDTVEIDQPVVNFKQPEPVKSPVTGKVIEVNCIKGQRVAPGAPLMIIADTDPFYLMASVEEADISKVDIGHTARITPDAYPDLTLEGIVESINFIATETPLGGTVFPVKLKILATDGAVLRLGMTADTDIFFAKLEDVIVAPKAAVMRRDGKNVVFVVENSMVRRQEVTLGVSTDDLYEITGGLAPGQVIVTKSTSPLEGGEKILPLNAS